MPLIGQSVASTASVVQCLTTKLGDTPLQVPITGAYTAGGASVSVAAGDIAKFHADDIWDFDDTTNETIYVTAASGTTVTFTTYGGTTNSNHSSGAILRKRPRWTRNQKVAAISEACDALWPMVWDVTTTTLTYSASALLYAVPTDYMGFIFAVQKGTETTNTNYYRYNFAGSNVRGSDGLTVFPRRGLPTADFASGMALNVPSWYNTTNTITLTYARKVTSSTVSTGLEADTVCWGACATLLYGAAILRSGPGLPADQNAPSTIDRLRVGATALAMWRRGKADLHQELMETYPLKTEWKW